MKPPRSCAPRIANFSIGVNDVHNGSLIALVQIPTQLGYSNDPITFRIPPGIMQSNTSRVTVTAKISDDEEYVSVISKFDHSYN